MTTPERDAVTRARVAVRNASIMCDCGHSVSFHGEGYEDSCTVDGCQCSRNAADAHGYGKVPDGVIDAYRAALLAEVVAVVAGMDKFGPVERFDGVAMEQDNLATWINRYDALDRIRALKEARDA